MSERKKQDSSSLFPRWPFVQAVSYSLRDLEVDFLKLGFFCFSSLSHVDLFTVNVITAIRKLVFSAIMFKQIHLFWLVFVKAP